MMKSLRFSLGFSIIAYTYGVLLSKIHIKEKIAELPFRADFCVNADIFIPILINNLCTVILTVLGGFTMAVITTLELAWNGMIIGGLFVILPIDVFLSFVLPHAIFENPCHHKS